MLAVYFVFFSVQLFLRFDLSHSRQSLESESYQKNFSDRSVAGKIIIAKSETNKDKSLTYLNKRFHPKNEIIIPDLDFEGNHFYSAVPVKFYLPDNTITPIKINSASLRGPPALG